MKKLSVCITILSAIAAFAIAQTKEKIELPKPPGYSENNKSPFDKPAPINSLPPLLPPKSTDLPKATAEKYIQLPRTIDVPIDEKCLPYKRPVDIVDLVEADLATIAVSDRPFIRYIWVPDGERLNVALHRLVMNISISRSSNFVKPFIFADNQLVRWDFRFFSGSKSLKDIAEILSLHEEFENEPQFHDTTEIEGEVSEEAASEGKAAKKTIGSIISSTGATVAAVPAKKAAKVKVSFAFHLGNLEKIKRLSAEMKTNVPIVRHELVAIRYLSTKDLGYGRGLYYDAAEIKTFADKNDFEEFLKSMGIDFKKVEDENIKDAEFVTKSKVTGHIRKVIFVTANGFRPSAVNPIIIWTEDLGNDQTKIANDGFRNVRKWKAKVIEAIGFKTNGFPKYGLFEFGSGKRQDAAPVDVVADYRIPIGNSLELQGAVSCIRCHSDEQGWKDVATDFSSVISGKIDLLDDIRNVKENKLDVIESIASQFGNNIKKPLRRIREDFSEATILCTGEKIETLGLQLQYVFEDYLYSTVDTKKAMQELGYAVSKKDAASKFSDLIIKVPLDETTGISPEDVVIAMLRQDRPVNRWQFNTVFSDLMQRAILADSDFAIPGKKESRRKGKELPLPKGGVSP